MKSFDDKVIDINRDKPLIIERHNPTLDDSIQYVELDLLRHLPPDHLAVRMAREVSKICDIPESTCFMVGIGAFSTVSCRAYKILYENGKSLPTSLYIAAEQPSGIGKSRCLDMFLTPFYKMQDNFENSIKKELSNYTGMLSKEDEAEIKQLNEKMDDFKQGFFTTNTTIEGLELVCHKTGGFYSVVASEQGALNTILGLIYGDDKKEKNTDIIMHGFDGGINRSFRIGRKAFFGKVIGGFSCFAQEGTARKILEASNGSGLSERFMFAVEPHFLGKRDHLARHHQDDNLHFEYEKKCLSLTDKLINQKKYDDLPVLTLSAKGIRLINEYQNEVEPHLIDGGELSSGGLRGGSSKINMQIMKLSANLHILGADLCMKMQIDDSTIIKVIEMAKDIIVANKRLVTSLGIIGDKAAFDSIMNLFKDNDRPRIERSIITCKVQTAPFKQHSGGKAKEIRRILDLMVKQRVLKLEPHDGANYYSPWG
jgi:hypothetical protein